MIKVLLWDVDGTLLDFQAAERQAIRRCFAIFGLGECPDDMLQRYSAINQRYWRRLERGELTKPQVLLGRFEEFFSSEGLPRSLAADFNREYQLRLGDTVVFRDGADHLLPSLANDICPTVMSGIPVLLSYLFNKCQRLFFGRYRAGAGDETGFFLHNLTGTALVKDPVSLQLFSVLFFLFAHFKPPDLTRPPEGNACFSVYQRVL